MGLYMNDSIHQNLYKNDGKIKEPNQGYFVKNHLSEMIHEQQQINKLLQRSLHEISQRYEQQEYKNTSRWEKIGSQLAELRKMNEQHEVMENQVSSQLKKLDADYQRLDLIFDEDRLSGEKAMEKLSQLTASQEIFRGILEDISRTNEQLDLKIEEQTNQQKQLSEQMAAQDTSNDEVTKRLDNQEALMEKLVRQMDYFRSLVFERTNYLSEKIEQTSSYILSLISGSDQLKTNHLRTPKKKEAEKSSK
ncbi:hypothetical protein [Oceanobacillus saliphilus]|uniref:hypothetical protein n=1 Tax=Oceanobacillus saliphilus TaxID=2925834 RepID=UPI00201E61B0|nr:hypothetical protein [Oceanobacillus saliphilus]